MKRKLFSAFTALALVLSLFPAPALALEEPEPQAEGQEEPQAAPADEAQPLALADEGDPAPQAEGDPDGSPENPWPCGANVTATLSDDGTLTISGSGAMADYDSASSLPWYSQRISIKKVDIQNGVTSIGNNAFAYCISIETISIARTVQSIGTYAFSECRELTGVVIPEGVKTIEDYTFIHCYKLASVTIPSTVTTIGDHAFDYCTVLKSVTLPDGLTTIKDSAFQSSGLTEVKIPDSVTSIGMTAFCDCLRLTMVEIPASVKTIGHNAFANSPSAAIYYEGTTEQWNSIGGGDSGAETGNVHTSDSDLFHQVTIVGGGTDCFGSGPYKKGVLVTVSAGTNGNYAFTGWTVEPEDVTLETNLETGLFDATQAEISFYMPEQDVTLTANWAEAVAQVGRVGGVLFTDLQKAFDYATEDPTMPGAIYLLKDVTVTEPITMSQGYVDLWGQGKTITGTGTEVLKVTDGTLSLLQVTVKSTYEGSEFSPGIAISIGSGASLNISDSATVSATGPIGRAISSAGALNISGGTVSATGGEGWGIYSSAGTVKIQGGTISGAVGLRIDRNEALAPDTIQLTGGSFSGSRNAVVYANGLHERTLRDLLSEGYTIYKDGTALTAEELADNKTGSGTFTVDCAHPSVGTVTSSGPDRNGVVTVGALCGQCEKYVTLGTLTMVNDGLTITYGDEDPTFEVRASEGLMVTGYKWTGLGVSAMDNTSPTITPFVAEAGEFEYTCEVTFNVPGGTASADLKFTLTVEPLDISKVEWTVTIKNPEKAIYNGKPQKITTLVAAIKGNEHDIFGEGQFDIQLVDASGTPAAEQTDAGTYKIRLTGKGDLTGTVTLESPTFTIEKAEPTIEWAAGAAESHEYTGGPAVIEQAPSVTVTGMTYDGEAITYSYAAAEAGPYTPGLPTNAGAWYVKAAVPEQKNYAAVQTAAALTLTITKAATEITKAPAAANLTYNGTAQALVTAAEASVGEVQYALSEDGPWSTDLPTAVDAGNYTVYYKVDETANYTGVEAQSVPAKIEKAAVAAASQSLPVKNNQEKTYTLDLSLYLPTLPQGQEYGKLVYKAPVIEEANEQYIDPGTVTLTGTVLTVPVKAVNTTDIASVALITVTIESDNFQDISLIISVASTNQTPVTITGVTPAGWTYDGKSHPGYTGTPSAGEYTGRLNVTYIKWSPGDEPDGEPKDAGTYQVLISVPYDNTEYEGEIALFFTVEPAQVTVKAEDKTAYVGEELPELTYQVSGLAAGESLKTDPTPACTADMSKAGTYPIAVSGGAVPDGGNYKAEIVYQPGTLTVKEKSAPPKPVDPDPGPDEPDPPVDPGQIKTKTEVEEGISQVPEGLKNIPALDSAPKLEAVMRASVTQTGIPTQNTAVYDVKLMVSTDGGRTWTPADSANFPSGGLTITLPYPAGTDSTYQFTVVHMFTSAAFGKTPGDTESPAVTNTEAGLRFTVNGLSPISVGWKEKEPDRPVTPGRPSGGGSSSSGGSRPMASITVERAEHGKVTSDRSSAGSGSPVTLTVQPDRGYLLESLTVTDSRGQEVRLSAQSGGKYVFTMPGTAVTVRAAFVPLPEGAGALCGGGEDCPSRGFRDLGGVGTWYHEAVDYVLRNGLMNGYGNGLFGPEGRLSRAQFAQILYNKEGRPAGAGSAPFTDVAADAWCAPAIAWAAERGIAGGYGNGIFGPDDPITREQLAVMLWRYAGSPAASQEPRFHDTGKIGAYAREAVAWAAESGVMNGRSDGALDPKGLATRAQTAQMLKNFLENG